MSVVQKWKDLEQPSIHHYAYTKYVWFSIGVDAGFWKCYMVYYFISELFWLSRWNLCRWISILLNIYLLGGTTFYSVKKNTGTREQCYYRERKRKLERKLIIFVNTN